MSNISAVNVKENIGQYMLADGMDYVIDLNKSHGSWLADGRNGKEYLDLFSMFASMSVGYNHPYLIKNKDRLMNAAMNKPTNSDIYSSEMAEFVDTMGRLAQPDYLPYAFYIEGVVTEIVSILFFIMGHVFKKSVVFINYISILLLICRILDDIMLDVFQRNFISNHMIIEPRLPFKLWVVVFANGTGDSGFV